MYLIPRSPIRRYADVHVHRQLMDALAGEPFPALPDDQLRELASHLNKKNRSAKAAQRDSVELFQILYFSKVNKDAAEDAVIVGIRASGFIVLIPRYFLLLSF